MMFAYYNNGLSYRAVQPFVPTIPAVESVAFVPAVLDDEGNIVTPQIDEVLGRDEVPAIPAYVAQEGEVLFDHVATPEELTTSFSGYAAAYAAANPPVVAPTLSSIQAQLVAMTAQLQALAESNG